MTNQPDSISQDEWQYLLVEYPFLSDYHPLYSTGWSGYEEGEAHYLIYKDNTYYEFSHGHSVMIGGWHNEPSETTVEDFLKLHEEFENYAI